MRVEDFVGCNQKEGQLVVEGIGRKLKILQADSTGRKRLFERKKEATRREKREREKGGRKFW